MSWQFDMDDEEAEAFCGLPPRQKTEIIHDELFIARTRVTAARERLDAAARHLTECQRQLNVVLGLPSTPAGKIAQIQAWLNPVDEEGNSLPPFISVETAKKLLEIP